MGDDGEARGMNRYPAIEGLRGWLAWSVVSTHLIFFSGVDADSRFWHLVRRIGDNAVLTFIVISGFVIAHLLLSRREPYAVFVKRRALRLFPAYLAVLPFGLLAFAIARIDIFAYAQTHADTEQVRFTASVIDTMLRYPWWHGVLHSTMLHGLFPNNVLPLSEFSILPPAWCLSLEWQFYLVAPLLVAALIDRAWRWPVVALIAAGAFAYAAGWFGEFGLPSMIIGAGPYLLAGIALRLALPLPWLRSTRLSRALFESPLPRHAGQRSYSIYLVHYPIIQILVYTLPLGEFSPLAVLCFLTPATIILTLWASSLLYRHVEHPFAAPRRIGATQ